MNSIYRSLLIEMLNIDLHELKTTLITILPYQNASKIKSGQKRRSAGPLSDLLRQWQGGIVDKLSKINGIDVQRKNVVNNVDM